MIVPKCTKVYMFTATFFFKEIICAIWLKLSSRILSACGDLKFASAPLCPLNGFISFIQYPVFPVFHQVMKEEWSSQTIAASCCSV